mgnify:CR=1 FL=1
MRIKGYNIQGIAIKENLKAKKITDIQEVEIQGNNKVNNKEIKYNNKISISKIML